jgi:hypothetical protein
MSRHTCHISCRYLAAYFFDASFHGLFRQIAAERQLMIALPAIAFRILPFSLPLFFCARGHYCHTPRHFLSLSLRRRHFDIFITLQQLRCRHIADAWLPFFIDTLILMLSLFSVFFRC